MTKPIYIKSININPDYLDGAMCREFLHKKFANGQHCILVDHIPALFGGSLIPFSNKYLRDVAYNKAIKELKELKDTEDED